MSKYRWLTIAGVLFIAAAQAGRSDEPADLPVSDSVVPQMYATGFESAEGLALERKGDLYVAGYRGDGNIGRITLDGTASVWCTLDKLLPLEGRHAWAAGMKIDAEGRVVAADAGCGRLLRITASGTEGEVLADRVDGVRFKSIRGVALDLAGNIYFTDSGGSSLASPVGAVYRYDINTKRVTQLVDKLAFPCGIAVAPDQQHLCVSDSLTCSIWIYDLSPEGAATNGRVLIRFDAGPSADKNKASCQPGGIVFDLQGRLFVAMRHGTKVNAVDMAGKLLRQYDAGGSQATNCHFHGPYLYTTIAAKEAVFRLRLGVRGFDYAGP
jgi:sugar lactone lactonase YvrE